MNKLLLRFEWYRMKHLDSYIPEEYKKAYENIQRGIPVSFEEAHKVCEIVENVKRGGNMNEELEEAKSICNAIKKNIKCDSTFDLNILKLNRNNELALETVLNYIENSISKEVIKEKIEELEKSQFKVKNNKLIYSREDVFRFQIYILEELLEGK